MTPSDKKPSLIDRARQRKDRVELFETILKTPRNKRRPIFQAYADKYGLTLASVRVQFSNDLKAARPEAVKQRMEDKKKKERLKEIAPAVEVVVREQDDAEAMLNEAVETFREIKDGDFMAKDRVSAAKGLMQAAQTYLQVQGKLGSNGAQAIQVNIANVVKTNPPETWLKDDWRAVFMAMAKNEIAKNEMREFARQYWGWRIEER